MSAHLNFNGRHLGVAKTYRGKRLSDVVVAAVGIVLTSPIQLVVAILVHRNLGRPILFRQTRPGLHGQPFEMIKFRTMLTPSQAGGAESDADRLTPFGAWLRGTSLDELPSLWNVFRGDMSLVGPRPLLMHYLPHYSPEQARRHDVRPGLTGLAQVAGRNAIDWERRLSMDVEYVDRHSVGLDLRILGQTLDLVLRKKGIAAEGEVTMRQLAPAPATETNRMSETRPRELGSPGSAPDQSPKQAPAGLGGAFGVTAS